MFGLHPIFTSPWSANLMANTYHTQPSPGASPSVIPTNPATPAGIPEWLRVKEACHYSRLSKPKLYQLLNAGKLRSVALRERGQIRGTRIISFTSLRQFLESRATGGEECADTSEKPR